MTATEDRQPTNNSARNRRDRTPPISLVAIGDIDPMSLAAYRARVPLCGQKHRGRTCTRAAGHDDATALEARQHVATSLRTGMFVVLSLWIL